MVKLLLMSVVLLTLVLPTLSARSANPRKALRQALFFTGIVVLLYALALKKIYPLIYYPPPLD